MQVRPETPSENVLPAVFRDDRILQGIAQLCFVLIVVLVLNNLSNRINTALEATNQSPNFDFLQNRAGFDIADSGDYESSDRYVDAFQVGFCQYAAGCGTWLGCDHGDRHHSWYFFVEPQLFGAHIVASLRRGTAQYAGAATDYCLVFHSSFCLATATGGLCLSTRGYPQPAAFAVRRILGPYSFSSGNTVAACAT